MINFFCDFVMLSHTISKPPHSYLPYSVAHRPMSDVRRYSWIMYSCFETNFRLAKQIVIRTAYYYYYCCYYYYRSQWSSGNMPDCGVRWPRFESHRGQLHVYRKNTMIYSLGHGLHTLTAVPRSTQPSTLRGMAKWVSVFCWVIIINGDGGCGFLAAYRRTHSPGLRVGGRLAPCHIHYVNRVNSRGGFELRWQHHKYCRYHHYY